MLVPKRLGSMDCVSVMRDIQIRFAMVLVHYVRQPRVDGNAIPGITPGKSPNRD